eukprot:TRINITY_DN80998_c0_g1_i1.p1 TRINITY_DN80998_c0_g1~~TRINITY_DN80998_c0_g1_i1.p1  ORF type:complete len:344 (+),score=67.66 TRINITY_DN80998_c0_g1_i1:113-1144(+)
MMMEDSQVTFDLQCLESQSPYWMTSKKGAESYHLSLSTLTSLPDMGMMGFRTRDELSDISSMASDQELEEEADAEVAPWEGLEIMTNYDFVGELVCSFLEIDSLARLEATQRRHGITMSQYRMNFKCQAPVYVQDRGEFLSKPEMWLIIRELSGAKCSMPVLLDKCVINGMEACSLAVATMEAKKMAQVHRERTGLSAEAVVGVFQLPPTYATPSPEFSQGPCASPPMIVDLPLQGRPKQVAVRLAWKDSKTYVAALSRDKVDDSTGTATPPCPDDWQQQDIPRIIVDIHTVNKAMSLRLQNIPVDMDGRLCRARGHFQLMASNSQAYLQPMLCTLFIREDML